MSNFFEIVIKNFSGLSTETKPTIAAGNDIPNGSRWREVDTGKLYFFNLSDDTWHDFKEKDVFVQDQYSHTAGVLMSQIQGAPMTLAANTTVNSYTLTMTTGHSFVAGNEILMAEDSKSFHALVLSVSTDILTLNAPIDQIYTTDSVVFEIISNMTVDGSSTVQEFSVQLGSTSTISLDVTGVRFVITDASAMDDGTFGGIPALTRGIVFQTTHTDGKHNEWTARTNGKLDLVMNNKYYTDKAPAGENSVHFTWKVRQDLGVTLRIKPGEKLSLLIQDDLTDLSTFKAWIYGHHVTD